MDLFSIICTTCKSRLRVREEERASLAAHLHDSVLQSLVLIQRADDPKQMTSLARRLYLRKASAFLAKVLHLRARGGNDASSRD